MTTAIYIVTCVFVFVFGSVIGSFLNVVIYRTPLKQSIITEPSHCFSCGNRLKWYDMFPDLFTENRYVFRCIFKSFHLLIHHLSITFKSKILCHQLTDSDQFCVNRIQFAGNRFIQICPFFKCFFTNVSVDIFHHL